jgi:tetratricopeptide (TPR) repeat protein
MEQHQPRFAQRKCRPVQRRSYHSPAVAHAGITVWCPHLLLRVCVAQPLIWFACALATFGQTTADLSQHAKKAQEAIAANNIAEAKRELQAAVALDPKNAGAYANLGMVEFTEADYEGAAENFQQALKLDPSSASVKAFLGMCELRQGKDAAGRRLIEESLDGVTDRHFYVQAGLELLKSYSDSGMLQKAGTTIDQLSRFDSDNPEVLYTAYRVYSARAASNLQKLAQDHRDSPWLHEVLGQNYMAQERYPEAAKEFRQAIQRGPQVTGLHYQLGEALLSEERTEENRKLAEEQFRAELALNPSDAESLCKLAQIEMERANFEKAQALAGQCLSLRPSLADGHSILGSLAEKHGDLNGAIREFEIAERLAPGVKNTHYRLSMLFKKAGRSEDAQRELALYRKLADAERAPDPQTQ